MAVPKPNLAIRESASRPKVAGILPNLVPYHSARWNAFASNFAGSASIIEVTDRDGFDVLEVADDDRRLFERLTLFPGRKAAEIRRTESARAIRFHLGQLQPDILCIGGYSSFYSLVSLRWALRSKVPVVICSESNSFDAARNPAREWMKRRIVEGCATGFAGGTPQARYLVELGLKRENVFEGYDVVDNCYFAEKIAPVRRSAATFREQNCLPGKFFLACSRFGRKKNLPRLIEAYGRYRKLSEQAHLPAEQRWHLVIVGDGDLLHEVKRAVAQLRLGHAVHLAGSKPYAEIPTYYGLACGFVHASTTEQWGLVVNEAMASGLPVLVSNRCGCAPDLVQEGVNGFTFDPYSVEQLAELMLELSTRRDSQLASMGAASRRIIADWGPERFATGLKAAVAKALETVAKKGSLLDRALVWAVMHGRKG